MSNENVIESITGDNKQDDKVDDFEQKPSAIIEQDQTTKSTCVKSDYDDDDQDNDDDDKETQNINNNSNDNDNNINDNKYDEEWKVNCSDEESYYTEDNYRIINGKKIWEPKVEDIISLYSQLEHKGFIELKWQCPGRRSPSVHSAHHHHSAEKKSDTYDTGNKTNESNEFDFDDDFSDTAMPAKVNQTRKRLNQGTTKRSHASLNKVMQDIKKYHIQSVEQQQNNTNNTTNNNNINN